MSFAITPDVPPQSSFFTSGPTTNPYVVSVTDIGLIRAMAGEPGDVVIVASVGVAGTFMFDAADTTTPDDGHTVIVATDGGRWKLMGPILYYGGLGGDDGPAFTAIINANPYRTVTNALGRTLKFYGAYSVTADGVTIDLNGGSISQQLANFDSLTAKPPTAGTTSAMLNFVTVRNGTFAHNVVAAASTQGNGLVLTQCNGYRLQNITFFDADCTVMGGQLGVMDGCSHFASAGTFRGGGTALVHVQDAPVGAGWQAPFTLTISNWRASASKLRDGVFRIHSGDGITIGKGYGAYGYSTVVLVLSSRNGSYVGPLMIDDAYLDCVNPTTGTPSAIEVRADGNSSSYVYSLHVNGGTLGNGVLSGILIRKPETQAVTVTGGVITNFTSWGIDCGAGGTLIDINVNGVQFQNNGGNNTSGDVLLLGGGHSATLTGNVHTNSKNLCVNFTGTWRSALVSNCNNASGVANDISFSGATFTAPLVLSGNQSNYAGGFVPGIWTGLKTFFPAYTNLAAATAAGQVSGQVFRIGDALHYVP